MAELVGRQLVLALDGRDDDERDYWRGTLAPRIRDASVRIRLMSLDDRSERQAVLGRARALLMPAPLDGDHGLLTVETGTLGTPVVVFDRDGVEEFVADGVTGFVVPAGDAEAMVDAVDRVDTIDPARCRGWITQRFSHQKMVGEYRALYQRLLGRAHPGP
ncbi:MAG: glycosyltransferase [Actinobacteria bacterium]|nr:glycosyltransferase [Actinomycetota bacterium]